MREECNRRTSWGGALGDSLTTSYFPSGTASTPDEEPSTNSTGGISFKNASLSFAGLYDGVSSKRCWGENEGPGSNGVASILYGVPNKSYSAVLSVETRLPASSKASILDRDEEYGLERLGAVNGKMEKGEAVQGQSNSDRRGRIFNGMNLRWDARVASFGSPGPGFCKFTIFNVHGHPYRTQETQPSSCGA